MIDECLLLWLIRLLLGLGLWLILLLLHWIESAGSPLLLLGLLLRLLWNLRLRSARNHLTCILAETHTRIMGAHWTLHARRYLHASRSLYARNSRVYLSGLHHITGGYSSWTAALQLLLNQLCRWHIIAHLLELLLHIWIHLILENSEWRIENVDFRKEISRLN